MSFVNISSGQQQIELYFDYRKYLLWRSKAVSNFDLTDTQEVTRSWSSIEEEARRKEFIFGRGDETNFELCISEGGESSPESDVGQMRNGYLIEREEMCKGDEVEGLIEKGIFLHEDTQRESSLSKDTESFPRELPEINVEKQEGSIVPQEKAKTDITY